MNCTNCNTKVDQNYCPNCGQPAKLKRISGHYIYQEMIQVLNLEKGIFFTIKELLIRPGDSVRYFIAENRNRLVKPIIFIIFTSLLYSLVNNLFYIEDGYSKIDKVRQSGFGMILKWVQNNYGYSNIIMGVFIAFWTKIFFKKYNYNVFEILILLCFIMGMSMLFYTVFAIFQGLINVSLVQVAGIVFFIYIVWAIGQFFDKKKPINYVKSFASYILGFISFILSAILLGILIDVITKH